jgi:hypothetical protein
MERENREREQREERKRYLEISNQMTRLSSLSLPNKITAVILQLTCFTNHHTTCTDEKHPHRENRQNEQTVPFASSTSHRPRPISLTPSASPSSITVCMSSSAFPIRGKVRDKGRAMLSRRKLAAIPLRAQDRSANELGMNELSRSRPAHREKIASEKRGRREKEISSAPQSSCKYSPDHPSTPHPTSSTLLPHDHAGPHL